MFSPLTFQLQGLLSGRESSALSDGLFWDICMILKGSQVVYNVNLIFTSTLSLNLSSLSRCSQFYVILANDPNSMSFEILFSLSQPTVSKPDLFSNINVIKMNMYVPSGRCFRDSLDSLLMRVIS